MKVKRLTETAKLPTKANPGDLGYDLYADESLGIRAGVNAIRTGIAIKLPEGFGAIIKDRSSMALRGTSIVAGVIDNGYVGEIIVLMRGFDEGTLYIGKGQRIAQLVLVPIYDSAIEEATSPFLQTIRGGKGFGSSGT